MTVPLSLSFSRSRSRPCIIPTIPSTLGCFVFFFLSSFLPAGLGILKHPPQCLLYTRLHTTAKSPTTTSPHMCRSWRATQVVVIRALSAIDTPTPRTQSGPRPRPRRAPPTRPTHSPTTTTTTTSPNPTLNHPASPSTSNSPPDNGTPSQTSSSAQAHVPQRRARASSPSLFRCCRSPAQKLQSLIV